MKRFLPNSFFGKAKAKSVTLIVSLKAKSVSLLLRLYAMSLSLLNRKASFRLGSAWPFRILYIKVDFR